MVFLAFQADGRFKIMAHKKLIVIGNKIESPSYKDKIIQKDLYIKAIDSMDFVCRINRMMNYGDTTGTKTDGLYIGGWPDFVNIYDGGSHKDIMKEIPHIFMYGWCWVSCFKNHWKDYITEEQKNNIIWCDFDLGRIRMDYQHPCSVISMIDFFCNEKPWCDEYEIWFTGIDVENRGEILANGDPWKNNAHGKGGDKEESYIKKLISEGKLHWLDKELCE